MGHGASQLNIVGQTLSLDPQHLQNEERERSHGDLQVKH